MVYAPYGRTGVYEMQDALRALVGNDEPHVQVAHARRLLESLPPTNRLERNPFVRDHIEQGDAGLYDLLLHSRDCAYDVDGVYDLMEGAGLSVVSFALPGRYRPGILIADPELRRRASALPERQKAALAERLSGNIRTHVFYAVPQGTEEGRVAQITPEAVPNLIGVSGAQLAESVWKGEKLSASFDGIEIKRQLPKELAGILTGVDGKRSLAQINGMLGWKGKEFQAAFQTLYQPLNNFNLMRFSAHAKGTAS